MTTEREVGGGGLRKAERDRQREREREEERGPRERGEFKREFDIAIGQENIEEKAICAGCRETLTSC